MPTEISAFGEYCDMVKRAIWYAFDLLLFVRAVFELMLRWELVRKVIRTVTRHTRALAT